jgi:hypothetical protein
VVATVPVATVCANAGGPPSVAAATYGMAGTPAATELDQSLFNKAAVVLFGSGFLLAQAPAFFSGFARM